MVYFLYFAVCSNIPHQIEMERWCIYMYIDRCVCTSMHIWHWVSLFSLSAFMQTRNSLKVQTFLSPDAMSRTGRWVLVEL